MFKVLTLDGGGVRGYLSAKILANMEKSLNQENQEDKNIGERFDLIAGTSTGGIIACALAIGKSAQEVFELYEELIPKVFTPVSGGFLKTKYSNRILKTELQKVLGDKTLKDVIVELCITSVDIENSKARLHKSGYFGRNLERIDENLVDIALATSAAPTFFPLVNTKHSTNLTDGGIVANNPSIVAFTDAMQLNNHRTDEISLISIGTGIYKHMPYNIDKLKTGGKLNWMGQFKPRYFFSNPFRHFGSPLLELLMQSQSDLIHQQTAFLLEDKYLRINPTLKMPIDLDSVEKIQSLKNLADLDFSQKERIKNLLL